MRVQIENCDFNVDEQALPQIIVTVLIVIIVSLIIVNFLTY